MNQEGIKGLVSVILPAFNAERFIAEAIQSVLAQTYEPIETIIVDDGSTDGTTKVAGEFGEKVRVISQKNSGAGAARNRGIREARGEYIAFLDADDLWFSDKLKRQISLLEEHEDVCLVSGLCEYVNEMGEAVEGSFECQKDLCNQPISLYKELLLRGNRIWTSSVVLRKRAFQDVGLFDETKRRSQDYDMWIRVGEKNKFYIMNEKVGKYRLVKTSLTHKSVRHEYEAQLEILKKHSWRFQPAEYRKRLAGVHLDWSDSEFCYGTLKKE